MAERVHNSSEKMLPDLNFKIKFFVTFSISTDKKMSLAFTRICGDDEESKSEILRDFIFEDLKIKKQKELEILFADEINNFRNKIKDKIKKNNNIQGNKWFSERYRNKIKKYIETVEKQQK